MGILSLLGFHIYELPFSRAAEVVLGCSGRRLGSTAGLLRPPVFACLYLLACICLPVEVRALPRNRLEIAGLEFSTFPV